MRQEVKWEREGVGSGKALEPKFELGTPVAQWRYMSVCCPQGYRRRHYKILLQFKINVFFLIILKCYVFLC